MKLLELTGKLNELLEVDNFEDDSNNGLQVGEDKDIKRIGFGVDADLDTFKKAKENGCDALIVHHGISFNDSLKYLTGNNFQRVNFLLRNNLSLLAYHLPLDAHLRLGHNAQIAEQLNLRKVDKFGIGVVGRLKQDLDPKVLGKFLGKIIGNEPKVHPFGSNLVNKVSIVSGSSSDKIEEASKVSDCMILGEVKYGRGSLIKELGFNVIEGGHYHTEVLGLKALSEYVSKKLGLETMFLE